MPFDSLQYNQLLKLQYVLLKQNIPFVSYRLPFSDEVVTLVQHDSMPERLSSLQNMDHEVGFVVSPFDEDSRHGTFFLRPGCVFFSNEIDDIYIQKLSENQRYISIEKPICEGVETTTSGEYINSVEAAIRAMETRQFHKVVLSKVRLERLQKDFDTADFFLKLCDKYPHAFVSMVQLPEVGCWIGATPEPLMVIENDCVKTVSLAGTQMATDAEIESYGWSKKEIEEQGIVTDFVEKTLKSLDIKHYSKVGPANYQAANLIHLKTAFEFPQSDLKNRLGNFLKALHPTPSVGGLPKAEAREFILSNEKHDRSYYTGFLGPININEKTAIFVNLRCLQVFENQFILYSGAGITTSSVAENEWGETDNKMMTMMNVMKTPNP